MVSRVNEMTIGAVRYMNARPLIYGLDRIAPWAKVVLDTPRRLAAHLREGAIEVGLVPSIEYPRLGGGVIVPGISISSRGKVLSVLLVCKRALGEIRTVALDTSSLSSVALTRVLCREKFRIDPDFVDSPPDLRVLESKADAMLLIGDSAMTADVRGFPFVYDLGKEWDELTGLPFVYAFWLARSPEIDVRVRSALAEARMLGLKNLDAIASAESQRLGLPRETCRRYMGEVIQYGLGEAELDGLHCFYELCAQNDLCPKSPALNFCY